ncbi:HAD family hydrolase [Shewanella sp. 202IG2-18]|uniref:HAD family hydrolase n=1 Tax=Parashewanella hymeniacidonis TaxID=2807618 RepID=UPI0019605C69|nr:HAD family hydrolase [Parashewanella hymeniacidonis]MBM7073133.1 HAD family hydrolase [Parashewanella hymeniacidonis]
MGRVNSASSFRVSFTDNNQVINVDDQDKSAFSIKCNSFNGNWQKVTFTNGNKTRRYAVKLVNDVVVVADANKHLRRFKSLFCCFFRDQSLFLNVKEKVVEAINTHALPSNSSQATLNPPPNLNSKTSAVVFPSSVIKPEGSPEISAVGAKTLIPKAEVKQKAVISASQIAPAAKAFCKTKNPVFVFDLDDTLYVKEACRDGYQVGTIEDGINDEILRIKKEFPDAQFIAITTSGMPKTQEKAKQSKLDLTQFNAIHTIYTDLNIVGNNTRQVKYEHEGATYLRENLYLPSQTIDEGYVVYDKGSRYLTCCKHLGIDPTNTEVIFVDDQQRELDSMAVMANEKNIRLLNLHYKGAALKHANFTQIDSQRNTDLSEIDKAKALRNAGRDVIEYANLKADSDDTMNFMELEQYLSLIEAHVDNLDKDDQTSTIEATNKFILTYKDKLEENEIIRKYKMKKLGK